MKWLLVGASIGACVLFGLLGLTAGINLNPQSTTRYVPNWGSVGDWVSGVGALAAVAASLWLAQRSEKQQAKREQEQIEIDQSSSDFFASVRVISHGHYPATVKNVFLSLPGGGAFPLPAVLADGSNQRDLQRFPTVLGFREEIHLGWSVTNAQGLLQRIQLLDARSLEDLKIEVWTTVGSYERSLNPEIIDFLVGVAKAAGLQLIRTD
ncbi:hypothetical protein PYEL_38530 [Pseudomonas sp. URMO17WK12:I11]|uniref:hypothetical protein n=1 Tax=Pseudomonas sp. URMO17WK12:I11 TaxID=1283291 RepID=UPI00071F5C01|nr:hypothetical protein [Pseudomonas sp. URMO17WK12:I11]CRN07999.1 hypothetical protein PYEL_38530 [Pseudomonas sp. URMO17WK12:I11]